MNRVAIWWGLCLAGWALMLTGCAGQAALGPGISTGIAAGQAAVQQVSVAPLATCVGVVQQSSALLQSLKTGAPAVLPSP